MPPPRVGRPAPDFDVPCASAASLGRAKLADYRGRRLALVFYPRDFSMVCPARIDEFRAMECGEHRAGRLRRSSTGGAAGAVRAGDALSRARRNLL
jgi:hypothetical protein